MDKPKIMYNPATKKMTAMEPKDDNLVNSIYNSPNPVKRVEKLVKETTPPSSIAEYNKQQQDKIKPYNHFDKSTYPSNYTPQQRARLLEKQNNSRSWKIRNIVCLAIQLKIQILKGSLEDLLINQEQLIPGRRLKAL